MTGKLLAFLYGPGKSSLTSGSFQTGTEGPEIFSSRPAYISESIREVPPDVEMSGKECRIKLKWLRMPVDNQIG
jgi:hypothetical protein